MHILLNIAKYLGITVGGIIGLWVAFYVICWIFALIPIIFVNMKKDYKKPMRFYGKMMNYGYWILFGNIRIKVHASGLEKIPADTRFMLVSNHRSSYDNMVQTYCLKKEQMTYISKKENFKIPIARKYMKRNCYFSLDRGDMKSSVKVILDAISFIKNDYGSVGVFPEGTRTTDGKLGEFKAGCFKIALKAKCPVVISTVTGSELVSKHWPWKRTHIYFDVVKVLPYEEIQEKSTVEIAEIVRNCVLEELRKKGAVAGPEYNEEAYHL